MRQENYELKTHLGYIVRTYLNKQQTTKVRCCNKQQDTKTLAVSLAIWEAEIRKTEVPGQLRQTVCEDLYPK
jgi:hypothetical protein